MVAAGAVFAATYDGGAISNGAWVMATADRLVVAVDLGTGEVLWKSTEAGSYEGFAVAGDLLVTRWVYTFSDYDLLTMCCSDSTKAPGRVGP